MGWRGIAGTVPVVGWPRWEGLSVIGDGVQKTGLAHALAFVVDDDALGRTAALEADLHDAVGQMSWSFAAPSFERKGVVGADGAVLLDEEEFVVGLVRREIAHATAVEGEAVERGHLQDGMF